jgi:hypothetical protein
MPQYMVFPKCLFQYGHGHGGYNFGIDGEKKETMMMITLHTIDINILIQEIGPIYMIIHHLQRH